MKSGDIFKFCNRLILESLEDSCPIKIEIYSSKSGMKITMELFPHSRTVVINEETF